MHVRFSTIVGMPVIDDSEGDIVASVAGALIHPDTCVLEGFFVRMIGSFLMPAEHFFVARNDIVRFGMMIHVRSSDHIGEAEDILRLAPLLRSSRTILGQSIRTEKTKRVIGRCADIQFDTESYHLEWLFPRKFFWSKMPIPVQEIVEVTGQAIIVREPLVPLREAIADNEKETALALPSLESA